MSNAADLALPDLHDWSVVGVSYDWENATAAILVRGNEMEKQLVGVRTNELSVLQMEPWGRSISINRVYGPEIESDENLILKIEMQSGDVITLRAALIELR